MNDIKCSKCGGMKDGKLRGGGKRGNLFSSKDFTGFAGCIIKKARACIKCGYVEMYLDPDEMKSKMPSELWP